MSREEKLKKALKLKKLFESGDNLESDREGERESAREKFNTLVEKENFSELELLTGIAYTKEEFDALYRQYGSYADLILFAGSLNEYLKIRPKGPLFNSYYSKPSLDFIFRTDTEETSLSQKIEFVDPLLEKEILKETENLEFINLLGIEKLDLSGLPGIVCLSGIEYLKNLKVLNLKGTNIGDLSPLESLSALEYVDISDTPVSEMPVKFKTKHLIRKEK